MNVLHIERIYVFYTIRSSEKKSETFYFYFGAEIPLLELLEG
jgi:hypothetical protein